MRPRKTQQISCKLVSESVQCLMSINLLLKDFNVRTKPVNPKVVK